MGKHIEWTDAPTVEHNSFFITPKERNGTAALRTPKKKLDGYYEYVRIPDGGLKMVWCPYRTTGYPNTIDS